MNKKVHFKENSDIKTKRKHSYVSANKRSIDSIKAVIEKAEKLLSEDIDKEEEELSKVRKEIVLDIKLEPEPDPNPFPFTQISKQNYRENSKNSSSSLSTTRNSTNYGPSRSVLSVRALHNDSIAHSTSRTSSRQSRNDSYSIKNSNQISSSPKQSSLNKSSSKLSNSNSKSQNISSPTKANKTNKYSLQSKQNYNDDNSLEQQSNGHVTDFLSPRRKQITPFKEVPDYIDEVGVTGQIIKSYELNFDYSEAAPIKEEYLGHGLKRVEYRNGDVSFVYKNGSRRTNHNGVMYSFFPNGDKMQEFPDGTSSYKYAENGAIEVNYKNGNKIIFFVNGQVHHYTKDGRIRVTFPDGSVETFQNPKH